MQTTLSHTHQHQRGVEALPPAAAAAQPVRLLPPAYKHINSYHSTCSAAAPVAAPTATATHQRRQQRLRPLQASKSSAKAADTAPLSLPSILTDNPIGKLLTGLVGTPVFVGMEVVALLGMLALTDAGYSGDWSRIGAISTETELLLQKVTIVAWSLHALLGGVCAVIADRKGRIAGTAALKGLLFGSLHVFEQLVLPPVEQPAAVKKR